MSAATAELRAVAPTIGFLAAILVFGHLCAEAGVFDYLGAVIARAGTRSSGRLLVLVTVVAAAVTAVLTLDATVVLLTPIVVATSAHLEVPARPFAYACIRMANSGSLLLPVSNLTNLLAFGASGLSFARFAALAFLPWLVACLAEWAAVRRFCADDLRKQPRADPGRRQAPAAALAVLAVTVVSFVATSSAHVSPAWAALGGCLLLILVRGRHRLDLTALVRAASPVFCALVLGLAVAIDEISRHAHGALTHLVPHTTSLPSVIATAVVAAVVANLVNNIPATLVMVPLVAGQPALVLAVLVGVNIGPNATFAGSLANILWRRQLPPEEKPSVAEFHLFGALTVPATVVAASAALWLSVQVIGT